MTTKSLDVVSEKSIEPNESSDPAAIPDGGGPGQPGDAIIGDIYRPFRRWEWLILAAVVAVISFIIVATCSSEFAPDATTTASHRSDMRARIGETVIRLNETGEDNFLGV